MVIAVGAVFVTDPRIIVLAYCTLYIKADIYKRPEGREINTSLQTPTRLSGNISCIFCRRMSTSLGPSHLPDAKNIHIISYVYASRIQGEGEGQRYHIGGFGESMRFLFIVAFGTVEPFPAFISRTCVSVLRVSGGLNCIGSIGEGLTAWRANGDLGVEDVFAAGMEC